MRSAVPIILVPKDLRHPPSAGKYPEYLENKREKITNVKMAIPLVNKAEITVLAPKAEMSH